MNQNDANNEERAKIKETGKISKNLCEPQFLRKNLDTPNAYIVLKRWGERISKLRKVPKFLCVHFATCFACKN
jgi:hypothetical protein